MVRITVRDAEQMVSFVADQDTLLRLVAGCSVNPATLGDLLVATDIYQRGLAAAVMADLMEFDKALRREGLGFIHKAISLARARGQPLDATFQVIDAVTEGEALPGPDRPIVLIDLVNRAIRASAGLHTPASGEVRIHDGQAPTHRTVTYVLPRDWTIETL